MKLKFNFSCPAILETGDNSPPVFRRGRGGNMRNNQIHNKDYLKQTRRDLRNNLTPAEATLWKYLKSSGLDGRKFRRQHSIDNYIVDFYCPSEKLIIELDGSQHYTPSGRDADFERDEILRNLGFIILRFKNKLIYNNIEGVLQEIRNNFSCLHKT